MDKKVLERTERDIQANVQFLKNEQLKESKSLKDTISKREEAENDLLLLIDELRIRSIDMDERESRLDLRRNTIQQQELDIQNKKDDLLVKIKRIDEEVQKKRDINLKTVRHTTQLKELIVTLKSEIKTLRKQITSLKKEEKLKKSDLSKINLFIEKKQRDIIQIIDELKGFKDEKKTLQNIMQTSIIENEKLQKESEKVKIETEFRLRESYKREDDFMILVLRLEELSGKKYPELRI